MVNEAEQSRPVAARCTDCSLTGTNNEAPGSLEFSIISGHLADAIETDRRL